MTARGIDFTGMAYLGAVALVAFVGYQLWVNRAAIGRAVNPADQANLANKASNAVVKAATGGADAGGEDSLGGVAARIREWFSGDDAKIRAMKTVTPTTAANNPTWEMQLEQVW